ncbi:MAG TPA: hypothetical protein VFO85_11865, partial [Vicinamibacteria bacterium]|nr:hypothetical protein [Vicinamibacteria bacterium]
MAIILLLAAAAALAVLVLRNVLRWRGTRLVRCPETRAPAAVDLDVKHTLLNGVVGREPLRLRDCSRWPERAGCGEDCLAQVERSPEDCLVRNIVAEWYQGKSCVLCGKR